MINQMNSVQKITDFYASKDKVLFNFAALHSGRQHIISFLKSQSKPFRVLDIGCGADMWYYEVIELAVDYCEENQVRRVVNGTPTTVDLSNIKFIGKCDLTRESGWQKIIDYTNQYGLFDFVICSHFLEDVAMPELVLEYMPKVAKMGFIATPSVHSELGPGRSGQPNGSKGYDHHLTMFHPNYKRSQQGELLVIPKYPCVEKFDYKLSLDFHHRELQVFWKDTIPHCNIFDYLRKVKSNLADKQLWYIYSNLAF